MARNAGVVVENNFVNGLVTEATGLNFPENAVTDTDNCVFDPTSKVSRRPGINVENGAVNYTVNLNNGAISEFLWESVGGNGNTTFLVQQIGNTLCFFNANGQSGLSSDLKGTFDLHTYATNPGLVSSTRAQFTSGFGHLLISHPYCELTYISYDEVTDSFSSSSFPILTRDFVGLEPHPVGRSGTITDTHRYNLFNQGWSLARIEEYRNKAGFYPSDYEVWWLYKTPDAFGTEVFLVDIAIQGGILNNLDRGNSPAPKGSTILSEFYQDRSAASGVSGIPVVTAGANRPSTCVFHAGRSFFSGVNYEEWSSKIYFSQIIERASQFGLAYQANDPTSQYSPDLLPSDGGVINIPDAGRIFKLWSVNNSLLVFASNGVWEITGSSGIGFSAIDYTVKKISSVQTLSNSSFVNVMGMPVWWGVDSIHIAAADNQLGSVSISSLSDGRIKQFYQGILDASKVNATGAYNTKTQTVQWLYRSTLSDNVEEDHTYDRILNFDTRSQAFYPWSVPEGSYKLKSVFAAKGQGSVEVLDNITDNSGVNVTDNALVVVTVQTLAQTIISSGFKYLTEIPSGQVTFSDQKEGVREDWGSVPFRSYFVSGYRLRGNAITKTQTNYLRLFNEGAGTVVVYGRWDYSNNSFSGRWGSPQLVVFDDSNVDVQTRRRKIRGHGLALQFAVESFEDEDFSIIGWSSFDSSNTRP